MYRNLTITNVGNLEIHFKKLNQNIQYVLNVVDLLKTMKTGLKNKIDKY